MHYNNLYSNNSMKISSLLNVSGFVNYWVQKRVSTVRSILSTCLSNASKESPSENSFTEQCVINGRIE